MILFGLVAIGILVCCLVINITSGNFGRAATAVTFIVGFIIWFIHSEAKEKQEKKKQELYRRREAKLNQLVRERAEQLYQEALPTIPKHLVIKE